MQRGVINISQNEEDGICLWMTSPAPPHLISWCQFIVSMRSNLGALIPLRFIDMQAFDDTRLPFMIALSPADLSESEHTFIYKKKETYITKHALPLVSPHTDVMLTHLHWGKSIQTFPSSASGRDDEFFYHTFFNCIFSCGIYVCVCLQSHPVEMQNDVITSPGLSLAWKLYHKLKGEKNFSKRW